MGTTLMIVALRQSIKKAQAIEAATDGIRGCMRGKIRMLSSDMIPYCWCLLPSSPDNDASALTFNRTLHKPRSIRLACFLPISCSLLEGLGEALLHIPCHLEAPLAYLWFNSDGFYQGAESSERRV